MSSSELESKKKVKAPKEPKEPKAPRAPRAKKQQPTKEETLKMLLDTSNELKQIILDLKDDEMKVSNMSLKRIPDLIKETISNLEEDENEIKTKYNELMNFQEFEELYEAK